MSSADTTLISAATIFSLNVVGAGRPMTQAQQLALTRLSVVGVGVIAWLIAGYQRGIIPSLLLAYTVFVGGVVLPTLASLFRERLRVTGLAAMWSVIVGGTAALLGGIRDGALLKSLVGSKADALLAHLLGLRYPSILPILLSLIVLIAVSRLQRPATPNADTTGGKP
jgi:Na+/proline symporter